MLTSLFDYDEIMRIHDINVKKSSAENIAQNMLRKNKYDIDEIVQLTGLSVEEVRELAAGQLETI
jgi:predicted transposase YdaD